MVPCRTFAIIFKFEEKTKAYRILRCRARVAMSVLQAKAICLAGPLVSAVVDAKWYAFFILYDLDDLKML